MNRKQFNRLVNQHWNYTKKIAELMYKEAFKHGYKHGQEDD